MTGILFEGLNLSLRQGTGIATYARNLNRAARACGYSTNALLSVRTSIHSRDPVLNEVSFFDANLADGPTMMGRLRSIKREAVGCPLGIRAIELRRTGVVADSEPPEFDRRYAAVDFSDAASGHFMRYGRSVRLKIKENFSLFHATHPIPVSVAGCPNIYTVHDIIPLRLPYATLDNKRYFLRMMRHLCRTADHIVTVSEHSKRDIIELFAISEERITNTYQAVEFPPRFLESSTDQVADLIANSFGLEFDDYFLFVGAVEPKKNLSRLIDAYAASGTKRRLIIAGSLGWQYERELEKIKEDRFLRYEIADDTISPRRLIQHLSYVPLDQLIALIRGARAVLFPSIYEGFGLPVLEAMLLGAPVMTSNVASLPEVAGDAALFVNPLDIGEMTDAIRKLDSDQDLREELRRSGRARAQLFSPENYRKRLGELYRKLIR